MRNGFADIAIIKLYYCKTHQDSARKPGNEQNGSKLSQIHHFLPNQQNTSKFPRSETPWGTHMFSMYFFESILRGNFTNISVLGGMVSWKIVLFLQNFEKALLENLICSYGISFSWKILCVLKKFWESCPEILMSSTFYFSQKIYVFLYHFWFS